MEGTPPICTGGIFEYISEHIDGLSWPGISMQCSLSQVDFIAFLCILFVLTLLVVFILSDHCIGRLFSRCSSQWRFSFSQSTTDHIPYLLSQKERAENSLTRNGSPRRNLYHAFPLPMKENFASRNTDGSSRPIRSNGSSISAKCLVDENVIRNYSSVSSFQMSKECLLIQLSSRFFFAFLILTLSVGTVHACFVARSIEVNINGLRHHILRFVSISKDIFNEFISESYEIMNQVIKEDVAPNNPRSYLRPFIEEMKLLWGDQVMRLHALSRNFTTSDRSVRRQTCAHLLQFNTLLRRISSMFTALPLLDENSIRSANDVFLSYSHEMARLTPHPAFAPVSWRKVQILDFTASYLCRHPTTYFPTCSDVEKHFDKLLSELRNWPRYEKNRDLANVTKFSLLPRLLNAEDLVEKWLPLARDPTGNIPFLFDQFLVREINKGRHRLNLSLEMLLVNLADNVAMKYVNLAAHLPIALAAVLTFLVFISAVVLLFLPVPCRHGREQSRFDKCLSYYPPFMAVCTTLFCIVGVVSGAIGSIGQGQFCDVLLENKQSAEIWLNHLLLTVAPRVPDVSDVLAIERINFKVPRNIISALDTNYTPLSIPFLQSISMSPPLNLSALLYSDWLNRTLYNLWYHEVWPRMERANLSYHIPRTPLLSTFNSFRQAVKLDYTFDDLDVGNVSEYLAEPSKDHYTCIGLALRSLSKFHASKDVEQLANYFTAIGNLIALYQLKFDQLAQALEVIKENKKVLDPLSLLIDTSDKIMIYLSNRTNIELVAQFTNNTAEIYLNSRQAISRYVIPLAYRILDRLLPYPGLRETYRLVLAPICPTDSSYTPLFLSMKTFGLSLSLSAFGLFIFLVGFTRFHLRERHQTLPSPCT